MQGTDKGYGTRPENTAIQELKVPDYRMLLEEEAVWVDEHGGDVDPQCEFVAFAHVEDVKDHYERIRKTHSSIR